MRLSDGRETTVSSRELARNPDVPDLPPNEIAIDHPPVLSTPDESHISSEDNEIAIPSEKSTPPIRRSERIRKPVDRLGVHPYF